MDEKGRCADGFPVNPSPVVAGGAKKSNYAMYGFLCEQPTGMIDSYDFEFGFTTCKHIQHTKIQLFELDDHQLGVHKVSSRTTHKVVQPPFSTIVNLGCLPAPETAWEAFYPEGSINPSADIPGGFSFYLSGPQEFADRLETASEVVMSYRMMLQDGWEWKKGGKLPGEIGRAHV